jgi:DNA-binding NarL/FixJ family response regulator
MIEGRLMPSSARPPVVAILNSNDDVVEMIRNLVEQAGFVSVHGHIDDVRRGRLDLVNFIQQHDPSVIVYDLVPPYDRSWNYLQTLRNTELMEGRQFVITSVNAARAREVVGSSDMVYEIIGKPVDLDAIASAIKEASKRRPTPRGAAPTS